MLTPPLDLGQAAALVPIYQPGSCKRQWVLHYREGPTPSPGGCRNILPERETSPRGRFLPHSLAPLQGLGWRDECLCVSVAMCVLSSPCSVGGLLSLCIVTPLTVVETATPINSSQEPRLALRFCFLIGNKLN